VLSSIRPDLHPFSAQAPFWVLEENGGQCHHCWTSEL
jgi:hypothetical protein